MKLFVIVVLVFVYFPVLLHRSRSGRADALYTAQMYQARTFIPSDALNTGSARIEVPATLYPAHPNNRGFFGSTVSISTAVRVTFHWSVAAIAKVACNLNPAQLRTRYVDILQWLQIKLICFIGGAITVCQYLLFLAVGSVLLQKHIIRGLALRSEQVVVPVPVAPAGPVVECRVPNTRAPVPPANRRPLVCRPLLNSAIPRLGGSQNNIAPAPQPVAPVQPPHRGSWIEEMSVEGKLVLCSHSTGPGGSLEWTVQFFPRREYWYYLSQYPANPNLNPRLQLLLDFRPFILKVPGGIMEEVFDYLFSKSMAEPAVDATSVLLPPSRPESPDGPTQIDMIEVPANIFTPARPDSGSKAFVTSAPSDTAKADTTCIEANFIPLPLRAPAPHKPNSTSHLQNRHTNPANFSHTLFQRLYSTACASIATQQIARLHVTCSTVQEQCHPPQHRVDSGMKLEKDDRAEVNITEMANPAEEGHIAGEDGIMQKDTADPDTDWVKANFVPLPHSARAPHESNSTSNLKTDDVNPTTCSHSSSQRPYSTSRVSIATQQIARLYITCSTVPEPPLPLEQAAAIRCNVRPQPADLAVRAEQRHPSQNRAESGMEEAGSSSAN